MKIRFPEGLSIDDTFSLGRLCEEGKLEIERICNKNGKPIYIKVRKKPRPTLDDLRERAEGGRMKIDSA